MIWKVVLKRLASRSALAASVLGALVMACSSGSPLQAPPDMTTPPAPVTGDAYKTPREIGAEFDEDGPGMKLEPRQFVPELGKEQVERIAVQDMMAGFGLPQGMGIEDLVVKKSTTALFSGVKGIGQGARVGAWDVHDREVWVVIVADLPVSLPCGPEADSCKGVHPAQWNLVLDARTGEVLATSLTGGGPQSDKWFYSGIVGKIEATQIAERANRPTPTPPPERPTRTTITPDQETATATPAGETRPERRQPVQVSGNVVLESPINFNGAHLYSRGGQVTLLGDGTVNHCLFHDEQGRRDLQAVLADGALMAKVRAQLENWGLTGKPVQLPMSLGMDDVPTVMSGENAMFRIHLGSNSDCPVTYPIGRRTFEFVVTRFDGTEVWRGPSPFFTDGASELKLGAREERTFEAIWDLKDQQGRPVPEGAYWVEGHVSLGQYAGETPGPRFAGKKLLFAGSRPPLTHWLEVRLEALPPARTGDPVPFSLKMQNISGEPLEVWHGDQPFNFVVLGPDGTDVWRWSRWRFVDDILRHTALAPGETVRYDVVWDGHDQHCQPDRSVIGKPCQGNPVPTGQYTVRATFEGALSDRYAGYQETIDAKSVSFTIAP